MPLNNLNNRSKPTNYFLKKELNQNALISWWKNHPNAARGLSCEENSDLSYDEKKNYDMDAIFTARTPVASSAQKRQLAFVIPFVDFQMNKLKVVLRKHWMKTPPCKNDSEQADADLIFVTPMELSAENKKQIQESFAELPLAATHCFANASAEKLIFIHTGSVETDSAFSHLEGAAYAFYMLFPILEQAYSTFFIAEPDVTPVQPYWLPRIVTESKKVNCEDGGLWQLGSVPLSEDVDFGTLRKRVDYHLNGNALYALGCPDYEDYKCRVQTFYVPKGECSLVGGCSTYMRHEGGYDHAMYRYRMHPDNYVYSRTIMHHFAYSKVIQNLGEAIYDPDDLVRGSPSTLFVHSKSVFLNEAAIKLTETFSSILSAPTCHWYYQDYAKRLYQYLRTGEVDKSEAIGMLCEHYPKQISLTGGRYICDNNVSPGKKKWKDRMPGKTYLWSMDFHGGPVNCDIPVITAAGGAIHAEIDGICEHYGLCKDRLKVIKAHDWHEFDPTEDEKKAFRIAYEHDEEFERVDAFICHHPVANCELFLPFNKPIIVHATTRLEFGRHDGGIDWRVRTGWNINEGREKWKKWIATVIKLAEDDRNVIAANNAYDAEYIRYFTGVKDVMLLPSWCGQDVGVKFCEEGWDSVIPKEYNPTRSEVMIVPYRSNLDRSRFELNLRKPKNHPIIKDIQNAKSAKDTEIKLISDVYDDSNPLHMTHHPAVIIMPYQISTMNLVELYRLNIPMFCPSLQLLKKWCREHDLMWEVHYGWPERLDEVIGGEEKNTRVPDPNGSYNMDKNSDEWEEMFDYWVPLADFYQYEHITYFDSWQEFFDKFDAMSKGDLEEVSSKMRKVNSLEEGKLVDQWRAIFRRVNPTQG